MKQLKNLLFVLILLTLNLTNGSKLLAQNSTPSKSTDAETLKYILGRELKTDSLLKLSRQTISEQSIQLRNYEEIEKELNKQIKLAKDGAKLVNSETIAENQVLKKENKELRRKRFWSNVKVYGAGILTGGAAAFFAFR